MSYFFIFFLWLASNGQTLTCLHEMKLYEWLASERLSSRAYVLFTTVNYIVDARLYEIRNMFHWRMRRQTQNGQNARMWFIYAKCQWDNDDNDAFICYQRQQWKDHKYVGNWKTRFLQILWHWCSKLFQWENVKHSPFLSLLGNAIEMKIKIILTATNDKIRWRTPFWRYAMRQ